MSTDDSADAVPPAADPAGPPWHLDVVADLHAGRYPDDVAGPLRHRLTADPWAASALAALDATVDGLSLLPAPRMPERFALRLDAAIDGEVRSAAAARAASPEGTGAAAPPAGPARPGTATDPSLPQPRQAVNQSYTASRLSGPSLAGGRSAPPPAAAGYPAVPPFLRAVPAPAAGPPPPAPPAAQQPPAPLQGPGTSVSDRPDAAAPQPFSSRAGFSPGPPTLPGVRSLDAARAKRRRWIGGLAAAAAVVAIGSATVASLQHSGGQPGSAAPAPAPGAASALELDPGRLGDALSQIEGKRPAGPLRDAATYSSCLAANRLDPSAVSGVTSVTFQGKAAAAIAVVVDAGHTRIVVVGPGCGISGAADQLASQTVER